MLDVLSYFFIILWVFIPIVLWAYIVTFIDGSVFNKKYFFLWIFAGGISIVPILYMASFLAWVGVPEIHVFQALYDFSSGLSYIYFPAILFTLLLCIIAVPAALFLKENIYRVSLRQKMQQYTMTYGVFFLFFIFLFFLLQLFFYAFPNLDVFVSAWPYFQAYIYNSLKLVIFYYLVVAILEESSKYFHFLATGILSYNSLRTALLGTVFVALWFSFIENILYVFSFYRQTGITSELVQVWFFRSIFSVILHVLCSSIISYGFLKFYFSENKTQKIILWVLGSFIVWVWLHSMYNISLTLWFWWVTFIYLIGGYLYIGSLFYWIDQIGKTGEEIG